MKKHTIVFTSAFKRPNVRSAYYLGKIHGEELHAAFTCSIIDLILKYHRDYQRHKLAFIIIYLNA